MYVRTSNSDETVDAQNVNGISGLYGSNINIHNNTIHDCGIGLYQTSNNGDTNVNVYSNNFYNNNWAYGLTCTGSALLGTVSFYSNHVHDYANWDDPANDDYHHNGIHAWGTCEGATGGVWVYNNTFDGNPGVYVTGHIYWEQWSANGLGDNSGWAYPLYIFNNVFAASSNNAWVVIGPGGTNSVFDNNTFINSGLSLAYYGDKVVDPTVKNNYFESSASGSGYVDLDYGSGTNGITWANETADIDYNYYAGTGDWNTISTGSTSSFPSWRSACSSCDAHSTYNSSGTGGVSTTTYQPSAGAVVIGAGVNLTSLGITALDSDIIGTARPATGAWDIGAYRYVSSALPQLQKPCLQSNMLTITASAGPNGSISLSGSVLVCPGNYQTLTITPLSGYTASVGGTCGGSLVGTTYTTNAITAACTVSVTFQ